MTDEWYVKGPVKLSHCTLDFRAQSTTRVLTAVVKRFLWELGKELGRA
jgi:hypothetical protein